MKAKLVRESLFDTRFTDGPVDIVKDMRIGKRAVISRLMDINRVPDTNDNALVFCASNGYTEYVRFLLTIDVDVHYDNNNALRYACYYGHTDIVNMLIKAGADISVYRYDPILIAAVGNQEDILKILLSVIKASEKMPDINSHKQQIINTINHSIVLVNSKGYTNIVNILEDFLKDFK